MSDAETEQVLKQASGCVEGECSIDEVDDLLAVLKETEAELEARLEKIMNMVSHLQHINAKEERKTDEVRAFVSDLLRVFSTGVSTELVGDRSYPLCHQERSSTDISHFSSCSNPSPFPQGFLVISPRVP